MGIRGIRAWGSGPADPALNILLAATGDRDFAASHHQAFKWRFVATLPREGGTIRVSDVVERVARQTAGSRPRTAENPPRRATWTLVGGPCQLRGHRMIPKATRKPSKPLPSRKAPHRSLCAFTPPRRPKETNSSSDDS